MKQEINNTKHIQDKIQKLKYIYCSYIFIKIYLKQILYYFLTYKKLYNLHLFSFC